MSTFNVIYYSTMLFNKAYINVCKKVSSSNS